MNPFISFCLYVAARVFVQYLKSRAKDTQIRTSLQFLLSAMNAVKKKNPLTESFLVQLDVDLEGAGIDRSQWAKPSSNLPKYPVRSEGCPVSQMGVGEGITPSYGDINVSGYTAPTMQTKPDGSRIPTFGDGNLVGFAEESTMGFVPSQMNEYELPNRARSPGSGPGSNQSFGQNMDTSPDASGGAENTTPNSNSNSTQSQQNFSARTSHTSYSPPNLQQTQQQQQPLPQEFIQPGRLTGLFEANETQQQAFSTADFDMGSYTTADTSQGGFVLPSDWGSSAGGGSGFNPASGLTPGATGMVNDMLAWTDADWNQMMDHMNVNVGEWQQSSGSGGG